MYHVTLLLWSLHLLSQQPTGYKYKYITCLLDFTVSTRLAIDDDVIENNINVINCSMSSIRHFHKMSKLNHKQIRVW